MSFAERMAIYDSALVALDPKTPNSSESAVAIGVFLTDTREEDKWLVRTAFIDGSSALLMRSMLAEQGTPDELREEPLLPLVRPELRLWATTGEMIPDHLRHAAIVSVTYWKKVAVWQEDLRASLRQVGMLPQREEAAGGDTQI